MRAWSGDEEARPPSGPVRCRCCPDGIGRSTRAPRYPSDMSEAEWAVTERALPGPAWKQGRGGRPAQHCRRDTVDAIRYLVREGIRWRAMPADFPHWRSVYGALDGWGKSGATEAMHDELRRACRIAAGREAEPTAAVIDSQSVKAAGTVVKDSRAVRDYERLTAHHEAIVYWAMIITMSRRLARRSRPDLASGPTRGRHCPVRYTP
jgi:transposase